jgi:hypothetical protein
VLGLILRRKPETTRKASRLIIQDSAWADDRAICPPDLEEGAERGETQRNTAYAHCAVRGLP